MQAPLCFLRSFCFVRIRLDPLGSQVLHLDCMEWNGISWRSLSHNQEFTLKKNYTTTSQYGPLSARNEPQSHPLAGQAQACGRLIRTVSRFTSFTKNFVNGCVQSTNNFCTKHDSANTSSARSPCYFSPVPDLAISVFREVSKKYCISPNPHFS